MAATLGLQAQSSSKELYELRIYQLPGGGAVGTLQNYLTKSLIPALNRNGVSNVGVFTELGMTEPPKVYLLIPYASSAAFTEMKDKLAKDEQFKKDSEEYNTLPPDKKVFDRYDDYLLLAFDGLPKMKVPKKEKRLFELRIYQGHNEDAVRRKVKMFNDEEFDIFYRTKLNPVFFGEMLAGKDLPALAYMIVFKDMEERDKNWKDFGADPKWIEIRSAEEYKNTVSRIIRVFLEPTEYSQI